MKNIKNAVILPSCGNVIYIHHAGGAPYRHTGGVSYHNVVIFCPGHLGITQQSLIQSSIQSGVVHDQVLQIEMAAKAVGNLVMELRRVDALLNAEVMGGSLEISRPVS